MPCRQSTAAEYRPGDMAAPQYFLSTGASIVLLSEKENDFTDAAWRYRFPLRQSKRARR